MSPSRRPAPTRPALALASAVLCAAACSSAPRHEASSSAPAPLDAGRAREEGSVAQRAAARTDAPRPVPPPGGPMLVRTAEMTIEVADAGASAREVEAIAAAHGGWLSGLEGSRDADGRSSARMTIQVRADRFMDALAALRELGETRTEAVTTEDVGRAHADLASRIRTKQAAADRMRAIMESRTGTLEDVIRAEQQLAAILEEVERLEGERGWLDARVAMSSVTVGLVVPGAPIDERIAVLGPMRDAALAGLRQLAAAAAVLTFLATVLAPWLVLGALGWALARRLRRRARPA